MWQSLLKFWWPFRFRAQIGLNSPHPKLHSAATPNIAKIAKTKILLYQLQLSHGNVLCLTYQKRKWKTSYQNVNKLSGATEWSLMLCRGDFKLLYKFPCEDPSENLLCKWDRPRIFLQLMSQVYAILSLLNFKFVRFFHCISFQNQERLKLFNFYWLLTGRFFLRMLTSPIVVLYVLWKHLHEDLVITTLTSTYFHLCSSPYACGIHCWSFEDHFDLERKLAWILGMRSCNQLRLQTLRRLQKLKFFLISFCLMEIVSLTKKENEKLHLRMWINIQKLTNDYWFCVVVTSSFYTNFHTQILQKTCFSNEIGRGFSRN